MFNSPILNLVILLSFTYFIGSIMLSAIIEAFSGMLKTRGKSLKISLENLLLDQEWVKFFPTLIDSQHLKSLMSSKGGFPSYIPAENFYMALMDIIGTNNLAAAANSNNPLSPNPNPSILSTAITDSELPDSMKNILTGLLAKAQANSAFGEKNVFVLFEDEVQKFYNNALDRASGSYKRNTRRWQLFIAFLLAGLINIDTIKIIKESLNDKDKLNQTVDNIATNMKNISSLDSAFVIVSGNDTLVIAKTYTKDSVETAVDTGKQIVGIDKSITTIEKLQIFYNNMGSSIMGYNSLAQAHEEWFGARKKTTICDSVDFVWKGRAKISDSSARRICDSLKMRCDTLRAVCKTGQQNDDSKCTIAIATQKDEPIGFGCFLTFLTKLIGIGLTAFALQLGSNYWFDRLNQFLNLRATGKKPDDNKAAK